MVEQGERIHVVVVRPALQYPVPQGCEIPATGQVIEVRYLYVTGPGGALYQPVYLGVRDDVDPAECTPDNQHLKYKQAA